MNQLELMKQIAELTPTIKELSNKNIDTLSSINFKKIEDMSESIKIIEKNIENIKRISTNIKNIKNVDTKISQLPIKQIEYVAKHFNEIKQYANVIEENKENIQFLQNESHRLASISYNIKSINDVANHLDELTELSENMLELLDTKHIVEHKVSYIMNQTAFVINQVEEAKKLYEKTVGVQQDINKKISQLKTLRIKVQFVNPNQEKAKYNQDKNILYLDIPRGPEGPRGNYKGDPGEKGKDGKDFKIDFYGLKKDMVRYGHFRQGTSFLSLDELPTRIYFKRSNKHNDWTQGQPFGIGCREYHDIEGHVDIVDGINIKALVEAVKKELES